MKKMISFSDHDCLRQQLEFVQRVACIGYWELHVADRSLICSDETYRIFGIHPQSDNLTLDAFWSFIHPNDQARVRTEHGKILSNACPLDIEYRLVCREGTVRHVHERAEIYQDDKGDRVLRGIIQDTTERWLIAEQFDKKNQVFRPASTMAHAGGGKMEVPDGRITWSTQVCDIQAMSPGTMACLDQAINFSVPESHKGITDAFYARARGDETDAHISDRSLVIRDTFGEPIHMLGSITDITNQKNAESELKRLNRALRMRSACEKLLIRATDEADLLSSSCRLALETGGYRMAWVGYAKNDERKSIQIVDHAGEGADTEYLLQLQLSWSENDPDGLGSGPASQAIRQSSPVVVNDITRTSNVYPWLAIARQRNFQGAIHLPLCNGDQTFGVIALYANDVLDVSHEEIELLQEFANNIAFGITSLRDRQRRQLFEKSVVMIATSISTTTGPDFFRQLVCSMGETVGAHASFAARFLPGEPCRARTIAAVVDGQLIENFTYSLQGTPCENLLRETEWVVPTDPTGDFLGASSLLRFGARAYIGRRLDNSVGQPLGLLFVLFREPLTDTSLLTTIIQLFASRAAAELEQTVATTRIREQASLLDKAKDAIIVRGLDGRVRFWNKGAERLYGWTSEEAIGRFVHELFVNDSVEWQRATRIILEQTHWNGESIERRKDGSLITVAGQWTLVSDEDGLPDAIFAIKTDISERKAAENEIRTLAFYDSLTRLPNRRLLMDRLAHAVADSVRMGYEGALLFIDIDHFKTINDTLGHDLGDELLKQMACRISTCVRQADTVARLGGDEFIVMLEHLSTNADDAATLARLIGEKILAAFASPFVLDNAEHFSTPSIGITLFPSQQNASGELLKQADMAMYQAKAAGRNTLRFFDPMMQMRIATRAALESDLRRGLLLKEFVLHFQPQLDRHGIVTGAEALVRWQHGERGMVPPAEFISFAEETGLIIPLGAWIIEAACLQLAAWSANIHLTNLTLAVNVSAHQFRLPNFADQVIEILARTGARPDRLKIELTESMLAENIDEVIEKMRTLQSFGVCFSLDDFGTGYSSLSYLKKLPLDQIKIDQSFVRDILTDAEDAAITCMIINLGHSLQLNVIAEGVETQEEWEFLSIHNCDAYQGYLFSRPLPSNDFQIFVEENMSFSHPFHLR